MSVLQITITGSPLADGNYTPQELMDAIVARLALETQESYVLIGTGSVLPSSDQGPFMLNGTTLYVWDTGTGAYVPQTIEFQAELNPKPFKGLMTANQTLVFAGPGAQEADIVYTEQRDPSNVFGSSTFVAPADGDYVFKAKISIAATAGTPTDNIVLFYPKKNGFQMPNEQVFVELGNVFVGRTMQIDTQLYLQAGDTISIAVGVEIGGGSGTWTIYAQDSWFSGYKVKSD
jgi:hypothetical protein